MSHAYAHVRPVAVVVFTWSNAAFSVFLKQGTHRLVQRVQLGRNWKSAMRGIKRSDHQSKIRGFRFIIPRLGLLGVLDLEGVSCSASKNNEQQP